MVLEKLEISNYGSVDFFEATFCNGYNYLPNNGDVFDAVNYLMRTPETILGKFKFTPRTVIRAWFCEDHHDQRFRIKLRYDPRQDTVVSQVEINDWVVPDDQQLKYAVLNYIYPHEFAQYATFSKQNRAKHVDYVAKTYLDLSRNLKCTLDELIISGKFPNEETLYKYDDRTPHALSNYGMLKALLEYLDNLQPVKFGNYLCKLSYTGFHITSEDVRADDKPCVDLFACEDNHAKEPPLSTSDALLYDVVRYCMTFNTVVTLLRADGERSNFPVAFANVNSLHTPTIQQLIRDRQVLIFTNDLKLLNSYSQPIGL